MSTVIINGHEHELKDLHADFAGALEESRRLGNYEAAKSLTLEDVLEGMEGALIGMTVLIERIWELESEIAQLQEDLNERSA